MDKTLEDRTKFKTIFVTDTVNGKTSRLDKIISVKDSADFLDSNGKPQFFIVDDGIHSPSWYPHRDFIWKECVKEKPDIETAIRNIHKAIEVAENKSYEYTFNIAIADLNAVLDELTKLYSITDILRASEKSNSSVIDALEGMLNELRTENKELKDKLNEKSNDNK